MASTLLRIGLRNVNGILEKHLGVLSICLNGAQNSGVNLLHTQSLVSLKKYSNIIITDVKIFLKSN